MKVLLIAVMFSLTGCVWPEVAGSVKDFRSALISTCKLGVAIAIKEERKLLDKALKMDKKCVEIVDKNIKAVYGDQK